MVELTSGQFAFRHALTRQAIYTNLLKLERAVLHQSIAEAIERLRSESLDTYLAELAYHFYQAGNWERALHYCWRAGERARQLYALQSAIDYFTQALDAAQQLGVEVPASLLRARGLVYEARGDFETPAPQALSADRHRNRVGLPWRKRRRDTVEHDRTSRCVERIVEVAEPARLLSEAAGHVWVRSFLERRRGERQRDHKCGDRD